MARSIGVPIVALVAGILAMAGAFQTVRVKDWVAFPALFLAVSVTVYGPRAVRAGAPEMVAVPSPFSAKWTPGGSVPVLWIRGAG
jgi:hypothetical protein